jgi:AraC-like DNA-binding protein
MTKKAYAHYIDRYCEDIKIIPAPGKRMLKAYRAVREADMDIRNVPSEYPSIVLPIAGQTTFIQYDTEMIIRNGSVAIRQPNEPYSLVNTTGQTLEIFVLYFTSDVLPLWNRLFPKNCIGFHLSNGPEIVEMTKAFFHLANNAPAEQTTDLCDQFSPFFLESLALNRCAEPERQADPRLLSCVQYMEEQFQHIRDAEEVAGHFNISRGTLCNLFTDSVYESPKKYLVRLKSEAAISLLAHTSWTLQEIAEELGYENADAFSKAFKNATGISPQFYRRGR